jgi:AcrR family transcriptional regulator
MADAPTDINGNSLPEAGRHEPALPPRTISAEDGRRLRSAKSRQRIVEATLQLVHEGNPEPAAEAVAARAGVGLRTVFRLFRDMESLCAEMMAPQRAEFATCFIARFTAPRGPDRVRELFSRLVPLYEHRMPLRRASTIRRYSSPSLAAGMQELDDTIGAFLAVQFPEIAPDSADMNMLNLLMSYEAWMRLRDIQQLPHDETVRTLRNAIDRFLP